MYDKSHYICHYRNLQFYLEKGLKLLRVHRDLIFKQKCWMEPYISKCARLRKNATSSFDKNLYKLLMNATFGKFMENVRNRMEFKFVNTKRKAENLIAKPSYRKFTQFDDNLFGIELIKTKINLNRPIYVGFSILDISKFLMYSFHYDHIKIEYPGIKSRLLFTDTDSFCYEIQTEDVYLDMEKNKHFYDFSDYPRNHRLWNDDNKKKIGVFKDETLSIPIREFVGICPKVYSILIDNDSNKSTMKGITYASSKNINHNHYRDCLFNSSSKYVKMLSIRSKDHNISTISMNKLALDPFDNKRYILLDGIESRAYGHYLDCEK